MPLAEGQVGTGANGSIEYSSVTSCLTVTCRLANGTAVGGHLSLRRVAGRLNSVEVLPAMAALFGGQAVTSVVIAGQTDNWNSAFISNRPLFDDGGTQQYTPAPQSNSLIGAVMGGLGIDDPEVFQPIDERTGSFTITPPLPAPEEPEPLGTPPVDEAAAPHGDGGAEGGTPSPTPS